MRHSGNVFEARLALDALSDHNNSGEAKDQRDHQTNHPAMKGNLRLGNFRLDRGNLHTNFNTLLLDLSRQALFDGINLGHLDLSRQTHFEVSEIVLGRKFIGEALANNACKGIDPGQTRLLPSAWLP